MCGISITFKDKQTEQTMIVEKRRLIRKCYKNYAELPTKSGETAHSADKGADLALRLKNNNLSINTTYYDAIQYGVPEEWEDDSILETVTTPKIVIYLFALLAGIAYFAIASYFFGS
jgi:hypothetical protein